MFTVNRHYFLSSLSRGVFFFSSEPEDLKEIKVREEVTSGCCTPDFIE